MGGGRLLLASTGPTQSSQTDAARTARAEVSCARQRGRVGYSWSHPALRELPNTCFVTAPGFPHHVSAVSVRVINATAIFFRSVGRVGIDLSLALSRPRALAFVWLLLCCFLQMTSVTRGTLTRTGASSYAFRATNLAYCLSYKANLFLLVGKREAGCSIVPQRLPV